jgi:hypothetical protein
MRFVTIRGIGVLVGIAAYAISCGFSVLATDENPAPAESPFDESSSQAAKAEEPETVCTSPKGTFGIETVLRRAEDPAGPSEQQYVVSTTDPKVREPLGEPRQAQPATYFISPDEQWIFADVHYGSGMGGARLYQRKKDFRFERVMDEKPIWKFFEKQALTGKKRPSNWGVEIVDFIAWSPDSARVLFSLRTGRRVTGEASLGYYDWHAYYNVRSHKFEVTDYLRALNRYAEGIARFAVRR